MIFWKGRALCVSFKWFVSTSLCLLCLLSGHETTASISGATPPSSSSAATGIKGGAANAVVNDKSCVGTAATTTIPTPHLHLAKTPRERLLCRLLDRLWFAYKDRVPYVQKFEDMMKDTNIVDSHDDDNVGVFINDHVAFRSFGGVGGIGFHRLMHLFEALGYEPRGCYNFREKHLTAIHLEHSSNPQLPKIFLSELKTWELPEEARNIIQDVVLKHNYNDDQCGLSKEQLTKLYSRNNDGLDESQGNEIDDDEELLDVLFRFFENPPWQAAPSQEQLETLNRHSQYAAWVLAHGYRANHFTALVDDIEDVHSRMQNTNDIPMKDSIEGLPGSKLRQTSTRAADTLVEVMKNDKKGENGPNTPTEFIAWPYAYFEIAERNPTKDENGNLVRFEGFLGPQAAQLFEMTQKQ